VIARKEHSCPNENIAAAGEKAEKEKVKAAAVNPSCGN
jgi:hypothetical protein